MGKLPTENLPTARSICAVHTFSESRQSEVDNGNLHPMSVNRHRGAVQHVGQGWLRRPLN